MFASRSKLIVTFTFVAYIASIARAGTNVAVIEEVVGEGVFWCPFLAANGYPCTIFPPSGPTVPLDTFQVVIDLSKTWTDPTGLLADFLQSGKGVITRGSAPRALGIETDAIVQAWVGGTYLSGGGGLCRTIDSDPILGSIPPGTPISDCGDGPCSGIGGESGFPNVKVLARWVSGDDSVGMMRNTWETGRSVYLPYSFRPEGPEYEGILLRTMQILSRPIPAVSTWGFVIATFLMLILGSLILHRNRIVGTNGRIVFPNTNHRMVTLVIFCFLLLFGWHPTEAHCRRAGPRTQLRDSQLRPRGHDRLYGVDSTSGGQRVYFGEDGVYGRPQPR